MAVVFGEIHGFEIKCVRDTLVRLPSQLEIYSKTLQRLTIVCSKRYIERVMSKFLRNRKLAGKHTKITRIQRRYALDLGIQFGEILEENFTTVVFRNSFMSLIPD